MFVFTEAHRALELLEDYHSKLCRTQDKQLRVAIERVIRIFKSRLFQALLGEYHDSNSASHTNNSVNYCNYTRLIEVLVLVLVIV